MQRAGKISFYVRSLGEEAVSVAQGMALRPGDMLFPLLSQSGLAGYPRYSPGHSHESVAVQHARHVQGTAATVMYHSRSGNIFSISGIWRPSFRRRWAGRWPPRSRAKIISPPRGSAKAPAPRRISSRPPVRLGVPGAVILNVVNNQWAISTFQGYAGGEQRSFAARGPGYGIAGIRRRWQWIFSPCSRDPVGGERARTGAGPTLIELVTYRAAAHSTSDDPSRYRAKDDHEHWPLGDPIARLKQHLVNVG